MFIHPMATGHQFVFGLVSLPLGQLVVFCCCCCYFCECWVCVLCFLVNGKSNLHVMAHLQVVAYNKALRPKPRKGANAIRQSDHSQTELQGQARNSP